MAILFAWLAIRGRIGPSVGAASNGILRNLSLLFVPAAVGIVQYGSVIADFGLALIAALILSTVATLIVTVLVFVWVARRTGKGAKMRPEVTEIWVYLSESPLLWLTVTLIAYVGARAGVGAFQGATRWPIRWSSPPPCWSACWWPPRPPRAPISTAPSSSTSCWAGHGGPGRAPLSQHRHGEEVAAADGRRAAGRLGDGRR